MELKSLLDIKKHLKSGYPRVSLVCNTDPYQIKEIIYDLRRSSFVEWEGATLSRGKLYDELYTPSLFAQERSVVVFHADKLKGECIDLIKEYLLSPSEFVDLILVASSIPMRSTLYQAVKDAGLVIAIDPPPPWERDKQQALWLSDRAKEKGFSLPFEGALSMVERLGDDRFLLAQELEKLITFVGSKGAIEQSVIDALVDGIAHETIWQLGDAILSQNSQKVSQIASQLLARDFSYLALIAALRSSLRIALQVGSLVGSGLRQPEIQKRLPSLRGRRLLKIMDQAKGYGKKRVLYALETLYQAEKTYKQRPVSEALCFQTLVMRLSSC